MHGNWYFLGIWIDSEVANTLLNINPPISYYLGEDDSLNYVGNCIYITNEELVLLKLIGYDLRKLTPEEKQTVNMQSIVRLKERIINIHKDGTIFVDVNWGIYNY